jgi:hypothetical protein
MICRLEAALQLAIFRSRPHEIHPYPSVCQEDILFVDMIRNIPMPSLISVSSVTLVLNDTIAVRNLLLIHPKCGSGFIITLWMRR